MRENPEAAIDRLHEILPLIARDAERYRNATELATKSLELHIAAEIIDQLLPPRPEQRSQMLRLKVGAKAIEGYGFRKNPYDMTELEFHTVEPGEEYDLRFRRDVRTDLFNPYDKHTQPVYGHLRYFDFATMGRTLDDGGALHLYDEP